MQHSKGLATLSRWPTSSTSIHIISTEQPPEPHWTELKLTHTRWFFATASSKKLSLIRSRHYSTPSAALKISPAEQINEAKVNTSVWAGHNCVTDVIHQLSLNIVTGGSNSPIPLRLSPTAREVEGSTILVFSPVVENVDKPQKNTSPPLDYRLSNATDTVGQQSLLNAFFVVSVL